MFLLDSPFFFVNLFSEKGEVMKSLVFVLTLLLVFQANTAPNKYDLKFADFFKQFENSAMLSPTLKVALENHGKNASVMARLPLLG